MCLYVRLRVRAIKEKRPELLTPNLVDIECMTVARHPLTLRSKGQRSWRHGYESILPARVCMSKRLLRVSINFAPLGLRSYCNQYVCWSLCLSARITRKLCSRTLPNVCPCCPWPWLGSPMTTLRYVMYFRFYGWRRFHTGTVGPTGGRTGTPLRKLARRFPLVERMPL